jgi:hypothetical protein
MGVCREVLGPSEMQRNGSILKLMLKQGGCREVEAAIRGLPLIIDGCASLRPLWTAKTRDGRRISEDVYGRAVQAWYQTQKIKSTPKQAVWTPEKTNKKPQHIGGLLDKYAGDAA